MSSNHRRLGRRLNSIDSSIRGMETTFGIESPETEGEAEPDVPVFPVIPGETPPCVVVVVFFICFCNLFACCCC